MGNPINKAVNSLQKHLKGMPGLVSVGMDHDEIVVYMNQRGDDVPLWWENIPVKVVLIKGKTPPASTAKDAGPAVQKTAPPEVYSDDDLKEIAKQFEIDLSPIVPEQTPAHIEAPERTEAIVPSETPEDPETTMLSVDTDNKELRNQLTRLESLQGTLIQNKHALGVLLIEIQAAGHYKELCSSWEEFVDKFTIVSPSTASKLMKVSEMFTAEEVASIGASKLYHLSKVQEPFRSLFLKGATEVSGNTLQKQLWNLGQNEEVAGKVKKPRKPTLHVGHLKKKDQEAPIEVVEKAIEESKAAAGTVPVFQGTRTAKNCRVVLLNATGTYELRGSETLNGDDVVYTVLLTESRYILRIETNPELEKVSTLLQPASPSVKTLNRCKELLAEKPYALQDLADTIGMPADDVEDTLLEHSEFFNKGSGMWHLREMLPRSQPKGRKSKDK
jgi:hypothetical protein